MVKRNPNIDKALASLKPTQTDTFIPDFGGPADPVEVKDDWEKLAEKRESIADVIDFTQQITDQTQLNTGGGWKSVFKKAWSCR